MRNKPSSPRSPVTDRVIALLVLCLFLVGCATVPVTGRQQLILVPESQAIALGADAYQEILSESDVVRSGENLEMVRRVGRRIAEVSHQPDYEWEFNLLDDDDMVNAFCLPGGKVGVYTGILPIAETEAGLATVMAHEIAHAVARHGGERMTDQLALQLGAAGLDALLSEKSERTRQLVMAAYGIGGTVGFLLPFSRKQETEADKIGLVYMAKAGYDPRASIGFWQRMQEQAGGGAPPEWLSTHPSHETRIEDLREFMPEALEHYEGDS